MSESSFDREFGINQLFCQGFSKSSDVLVGIGDDAAIVQTSSPFQVQCLDTLVEGVHFVKGSAPNLIGYKSVAVNLSDMAAMGATPKWMTLGLTLPELDAQWIESFVAGMAEAASPCGVALIGGDTTKGPLTITVNMTGILPDEKAMMRSGACVGDLVCVSGTLGDAGIGLKSLIDKEFLISIDAKKYAVSRYYKPTARVELGKRLRATATSAIDISDGLSLDLSRLLHASNVGALLDVDSLPLAVELLEIPNEVLVNSALTAGDDYELCFTWPKDKQSELKHVENESGVSITIIGEVIAGRGLFQKAQTGQMHVLEVKGYQHV